MKKLLLLVIYGLLATGANAGFRQSKVCQKCHPTIYDEFYSSSHRNSSIHNDPIHKAVWDKHPLKNKQSYKCAKCHTPDDKTLLKNIVDGNPASPQQNVAQDEGVSCIACHQIQSIEEHQKANKNIMSTKPKTLYSAREGHEGESDVKLESKSSFFGLFVEKSGSPYHNIDFSNKGFYNGNMCMGCHSHKQNGHQFEVCRTEMKDTNSSKQNCISCHMPSIQGTMNTLHKTKTHIYHGFAGASNRADMLAKYVKISFQKSANGFKIGIKNEAGHPLFLHPLRVAQLQVSIQRGDRTITLEPVTFKKVIGKDGRPAMPWVANSVVVDTQIKGNENRIVAFEYKLQEGDRVEAKMGFYLLSPKASKKLGLDDKPELSKFRVLKKELFN